MVIANTHGRTVFQTFVKFINLSKFGEFFPRNWILSRQRRPRLGTNWRDAYKGSINNLQQELAATKIAIGPGLLWFATHGRRAEQEG
jgi:hypothetical protein